MIEFEGRVAVVTGAGNGLGRAHALELARRGASVVVNDLGCEVQGTGSSSSAADLVVDEIRAVGGRAVASYVSVASAEGGRSIIETAVKEYGRVDAVILNAGILDNTRFHEMREEQLHRVIYTNWFGAVYVAQPAFKLMRDQHYGRFVFTSSAAGLFGSRNAANYASSKAAMIGLSSTLGIEGADLGIKSNVVAPGAGTRMAKAIRPDDLGEDIIKRLMSERPEPQMAMDPAFVTPLVVYLASQRCMVSQQMFSAARGRFARAFVGISTGWYGPAAAPASAEEIEQHFAEIGDCTTYHMPESAFDEMAIVKALSPTGLPAS